MTPRHAFLSLWIAAAPPSSALPPVARAEDQGLLLFEEARAGYSRASDNLKNDFTEKLKAQREKHRLSADRGKAAATKKGDLRLALAWEKLEKELRSERESESGQDPTALPAEPGPGALRVRDPGRRVT